MNQPVELPHLDARVLRGAASLGTPIGALHTRLVELGRFELPNGKLWLGEPEAYGAIEALAQPLPGGACRLRAVELDGPDGEPLLAALHLLLGDAEIARWEPAALADASLSEGAGDSSMSGRIYLGGPPGPTAEATAEAVGPWGLRRFDGGLSVAAQRGAEWLPWWLLDKRGTPVGLVLDLQVLFGQEWVEVEISDPLSRIGGEVDDPALAQAGVSVTIDLPLEASETTLEREFVVLFGGPRTPTEASDLGIDAFQVLIEGAAEPQVALMGASGELAAALHTTDFRGDALVLTFDPPAGSGPLTLRVAVPGPPFPLEVSAGA